MHFDPHPWDLLRQVVKFALTVRLLLDLCRMWDMAGIGLASECRATLQRVFICTRKLKLDLVSHRRPTILNVIGECGELKRRDN